MIAFHGKTRRLAALALVALAPAAQAQLTDLTQTPNAENAGIVKSLEQQIGAGTGDIFTPGSSAFIIARDPARSVRRGRQLFQRKFTVAQGFGPRFRDGTGNIATHPALGAGLVDSCAGCHGRPRGSAGFGGDVVTRPDSRDAPHLFGLGLQEMLADEITSDLRSIRDRALTLAREQGTSVTLALTSKGISYGKITASPQGVLNTSNVRGVDPDLRVKPFFAEGSTAFIRQFVVGAFNDEMGLQAVDPLLAKAAAGSRVTTPTGTILDGVLDTIPAPPAASTLDDPDQDGVRNEIPTALVDHMEFYLFNYFKPGLYLQSDTTELGRILMYQVGCTSCHIENLTINVDRRVADVETVYDPQRSIFNGLFATATALFSQVSDNTGLPTLKQPLRKPFTVRRFFADMKRHDLGPNFHERNFDGTLRREFMTEPLWGVGSSPPYGHDGRSVNLREVILRHGGEAQASRDAFASLPEFYKEYIFAFLNSLVLFPPDDTASNLDPGDRNAPGFPQRGHGSIRLPVLFNDPTELE